MDSKIKYIYTVVKPKCVFSSTPMTIEDIEDGKAKRFLEVNGFLPLHHKCHKRRYTDFNDKDGKEIYDGDILEKSRSRDMSGLDVEFWKEQVEYEINKETSGFYIPFIESSKVIGNVYENPELMES